ncbi:ACT domain-containing protein [Meiothermus cerbereus]|uniref:ACT domain-containing protein n=1 Tax=Meiothermus cerbereus TaxID=65552 RepID=UPI003EE8D7B5
MAATLDLHLLEGPYAVCQLEATAQVPAWAEGQGFLSISRASDELTIVCPQQRVPPQVKAERDWRCFRLVGPFEFALTGILAAVLNPLAQAGVGVFAVSTYNTDYVLIKSASLNQGIMALSQAGHRVHV